MSLRLYAEKKASCTLPSKTKKSKSTKSAEHYLAYLHLQACPNLHPNQLLLPGCHVASLKKDQEEE
jgi:hypothetical protein